jgi:hypothetical protein
MTAQFTIPLAMMLIIALLLSAATDQTVNASGQSVLPTEESSDLNALMNFEVFSIQHVGVGSFRAPVPVVHLQFFKGLFDILTWNFSYLSGQTWSLLRFPLMAITFAVGILVLVQIGPVLVQVADFMGRAVAGGIGVLGSALRFLR